MECSPLSPQSQELSHQQMVPLKYGIKKSQLTMCSIGVENYIKWSALPFTSISRAVTSTNGATEIWDKEISTD